MSKGKITIGNALLCDRCGKFIEEAREDHESTKYQRMQACILCGKDLCGDCGGNDWSYKAYHFLICPEHDAKMSEVQEAWRLKQWQS